MTTAAMGQKLTKAYFFGLAKGVYLVSNKGILPVVPDFAEYVGPADQREKQWKRIKSVKADQLLCNVFNSEDDFCLYIKKHHGNVITLARK